MSRSVSEVTDQEMRAVFHMSDKAASEELGVARSSFSARKNRMLVAGDTDLEYSGIPEEIDTPALLEERKRKFAHKQEYETATELITCKVKKKGPIGLLFFGDPHCDDDGTDIGLLEHYGNLTHEVDGLYGCNMGDTTNNWVGRLAHLYSAQSTSAQEAYALGEWFIGHVNWLFIISGNHDAWSGVQDPVKWFAKQAGTVHQTAALRMQLKFPKGEPLIINARHNFSGHSQYHAVHGVKKHAMWGFDDEIYIAGHKHISGYAIHKQPSGIITHAIQVASFEEYSEYAKAQNMRDQKVSSAVLTIIKPEATRNTDRVSVWHDIEAGVEYLEFLREK